MQWRSLRRNNSEGPSIELSQPHWTEPMYDDFHPNMFVNGHCCCCFDEKSPQKKLLIRPFIEIGPVHSTARNLLVDNLLLINGPSNGSKTIRRTQCVPLSFRVICFDWRFRLRWMRNLIYGQTGWWMVAFCLWCCAIVNLDCGLTVVGYTNWDCSSGLV